MRHIRVLFVAAVFASVLGCGASREKGKNADLDRPRPTDKK